MSTWIKTEDRLPEYLETVWLANPQHNIAFLGCLVEYEDGWCWAKSNGCTYIDKGKIVAECDEDDYEVTHWMPLPKPPQP